MWQYLLLQFTYNVKCLYVIFDKINEYIKDYDESIYLVLISSSKKFGKIWENVWKNQISC